MVKIRYIQQDYKVCLNLRRFIKNTGSRRLFVWGCNLYKMNESSAWCSSATNLVVCSRRCSVWPGIRGLMVKPGIKGVMVRPFEVSKLLIQRSSTQQRKNIICGRHEYNYVGKEKAKETKRDDMLIVLLIKRATLKNKHSKMYFYSVDLYSYRNHCWNLYSNSSALFESLTQLARVPVNEVFIYIWFETFGTFHPTSRQLMKT